MNKLFRLSGKPGSLMQIGGTLFGSTPASGAEVIFMFTGIGLGIGHPATVGI